MCVVGIGFPVALNILPTITYNFDRTIEQPGIEVRHRLAKIKVDGLDGVGKRGKNDTAVFCNLELAQWMLCSLEILGIAPLTPNATTERHADNVPL